MNLKRKRLFGFTILEVLIALTASLLLMLGLARAYRLLGNKITTRQSELDLSGRLRNIALRLRDELGRATCEMTPPASEAGGEGYFVYHEGPFTDSTTIIGSVPNPTLRGSVYFPHSQIGDIDDYLAFTANAEEGAPFIGYIPRGVLDAHRFANGKLTEAEVTGYTIAQAATLVPFYSDVAEIVYWLSPEWQRGANGDLVYDTDPNFQDGSGLTSLYPLYEDRDGDMLPDKMRLHRRVLLVRPDLNMSAAEMNAFNGGTPPGTIPGEWNTPTIPMLQPDGSGGVEIQALSNVTAIAPTIFSGGDSIFAPGAWEGASASATGSAAPHWLVGMARMQQVMDLSMTRVTDTWSVPLTAVGVSTFGMPTSLVAANSLSSLTRPENRFAHVRIPQQLVSGAADSGSTMPQIALCPPHPYLVARASSPPNLPDAADPLRTDTPRTFPAQANHVSTTPAPGTHPYFSTYGRFTMTTFLRPEFNLADTVSDLGSGGTLGPVVVNRAGTDVIAEDVIGFNVQIFDPDAPRFIWMGEDRAQGAAGVDDDNDGATDEGSELGWPGTDDEPFSVNDPSADQALLNNGFRTRTVWAGTPTMPYIVVDRGDFVDLGYMRLAGGPVGGLIHFDEMGNVIAEPVAGGPARYVEMASEYSGFSATTTSVFGTGAGAIANFSFFPASWEQSGRLILTRTTGASTMSSFFQPVYDTWTDGYDIDVFDQEGLGFGTVDAFVGVDDTYGLEVGARTPGVSGYLVSRTAQNNGSTVATRTRAMIYRRWTSFTGAIANEGNFAGQDAGRAQTTGTPSDTPISVSPPVNDKLRAIKVSIRVNDVSAGTIRQQSVLQEF